MTLDYKPQDDFEVNNLQSLVDFDDVAGSKELWLIQCPLSHFPEIEGKELKVRLDKDGVLGGFVDLSGKEVELVSFASQDADATVIIPSQQESKIVGKISRRVLFVRFPETKELLETMKVKTQQKLVGAVTSSSLKNSNSAQSSRRKNGMSETPKSSKRKHSEPSASKQRGSGSSERSGKSKKKVKTEK